MKRQKAHSFYLIARSFDLLRDLIKFGAYLGCAYYAYEAIAVLAGRKTDASLLFGFFTSTEHDHGLLWLVVFFAVVYGLAERRLRMRKTEYFQARIRELETRIDPNRSGSGLLPTGETHPEDNDL